MLLIALEFVPQGGRLALTNTLLPESGQLGRRQQEEWDHEHKESLQSLYNNVALTRDDFQPLLRDYGTALRARVRQQEMPAPDHCFFLMRSNAVHFGRRPVAAAD